MPIGEDCADPESFILIGILSLGFDSESFYGDVPAEDSVLFFLRLGKKLAIMFISSSFCNLTMSLRSLVLYSSGLILYLLNW